MFLIKELLPWEKQIFLNPPRLTGHTINFTFDAFYKFQYYHKTGEVDSPELRQVQATPSRRGY